MQHARAMVDSLLERTDVKPGCMNVTIPGRGKRGRAGRGRPAGRCSAACAAAAEAAHALPWRCSPGAHGTPPHTHTLTY